MKNRFRSNWLLALMIAATCFFLLSLDSAVASRKSSNLDQFMEKSMKSRREVEIDGNVFDVFIDLAEKIITIQGNVGDWEEKEKVERYFRLRSPSDYQLNYDIFIVFD